MLEGDFAAAILAAPGVAGLIGDRVYPVVADQSGKFPAVAYQVINKMRHRSHSGPIRLTEALIQVSAFGLTYREVRLIAEGIRGGLNGFVGYLGNTEIQRCTVESERDDYDDESEREFFVVQQDYRIFYFE